MNSIIKWHYEFDGQYDKIRNDEFDQEIDCIKSSIWAFEREYLHSESLFDQYSTDGWRYYVKNNFEEAKMLFLKSLVSAHDREDVREIYTVIGACECKLGNFDSSLKNLTKAINLKGSYFVIDPFWERAKLHFIMGNYSAAIEDVNKIEYLSQELLAEQEIKFLIILNPMIQSLIEQKEK
ncbi:MAG: hypothetical protein GX660_26185 [Clostridiaceae bacterium]|nr:hypothetical protein [Clostridiaceae bacterium]